MKKFMILLGILLIWSTALYAKGDSEGGSVKTYRLGMNDNPQTITYNSVIKFKEYVESNIDNIEIIVYPSAQLGDFRAMLDQTMSGELDIQQVAYPDMSFLIPELKIVGEPYVIKDFEHLQRVIAGEYGAMIEEKMNGLGITVLDVGYYGTRQTTSNKAINSIDDMKGLKIRVPNVDFLIDYVKAAGATPAPVAFHETYLALQTNQVDGEENPLPTIEAMKFYEVQKYIAMTNHFIASQAIVINFDLWNSFSNKDQEIFRKAAKIASEHLTSEVRKQEAELVQTMKDRGIIITEPDLTPFRENMKPFYDALDEKFGAGSVAKVVNY